MTIKKIYVAMNAIFTANMDKTVKQLLPQLNAVMMAKTNRSEGVNFLKDRLGNTVAIKCYYFKRWLPLMGDKKVAFGVKKNTPTGLNTMCIKGSSLWTAQNKAAKDKHTTMMLTLSNTNPDLPLENVKNIPEYVKSTQEKITAIRAEIKPTTLGFENQELLMEYLKANNVVLAGVEPSSEPADGKPADGKPSSEPADGKPARK